MVTVLGPIVPEEVGICLPHEHLLVDCSGAYFRAPDDPSLRARALEPFTAERRDEVIADFTSCLDNLRLTDTQTAAEELQPFAAAGGQTVVELTSAGIGRDPLGLRRISQLTGIHIVAGCGYYIGDSHPPRLDSFSEEELADEMAADVLVGIAGTGVKAGIIGEIGFQSFAENERRVLRAAAIAQRRSGASVNVHVEFILSGRQGSLAAVEILEEAGADLTRVILSHQDSSGNDPGYQELVLGKGVVLSYDGFGYEMTTGALGGLTYPTDAERIESLRRLVERGWADQLLISTDICMKFLLKRYGGHGYAHVLTSVVPAMRRAGIGEHAISTILVDTPTRLLALAETVETP